MSQKISKYWKTFINMTWSMQGYLQCKKKRFQKNAWVNISKNSCFFLIIGKTQVPWNWCAMKWMSYENFESYLDSWKITSVHRVEYWLYGNTALKFERNFPNKKQIYCKKISMIHFESVYSPLQKKLALDRKKIRLLLCVAGLFLWSKV